MFLISVSLVIFCLLFSFVDYVPVKGEITLDQEVRHCQLSEACHLSFLDHSLSSLAITSSAFCDNGFLDSPFSLSLKWYWNGLSVFELYIGEVILYLFLVQ